MDNEQILLELQAMREHMKSMQEEIDKLKLKPKRKGKFIVPSAYEISAYMSEKGCVNSSDETYKFINYYTSNGWKVGKNKMVSWKKAACGWIANSSMRTPVINTNGKQQARLALSPSNVHDTNW